VDEIGLRLISKIMQFESLPFAYFNKPSGYVFYYHNRPYIVRRTEVDFVENKYRILEEIERPDDYYGCRLFKNTTVIFGNYYKNVLFKFISTDEEVGLKMILEFGRNFVWSDFLALSIRQFFDYPWISKQLTMLHYSMHKKWKRSCGYSTRGTD
jgi:hypothetical protein